MNERLQGPPGSQGRLPASASPRGERLARMARWALALRAGSRAGAGLDFAQLLAAQRTNARQTGPAASSAQPEPFTPEAARRSVAAPAELEPLIRDAAQRYGIDEAVVKAVIRTESGFNPGAVSPAGAKGLMQLMDATARGLGVRDPFDPAQNIDGGVRYLRTQFDRFGSLPLALAAYNAGPAAVRASGGVPPYRETRKYVTTIMNAVRAP